MVDELDWNEARKPVRMLPHVDEIRSADFPL
jgi:hypothetical protein